MTAAKLLLSLIIGCGPGCADKSEPKITMHCFDVPKPTVVNELRVRKPTEASKDLLVDRVLRKVYLYDYEADTLTLVDRDQWKNAKGIVTDYTTALKTLSTACVIPRMRKGSCSRSSDG